MNELRTGQSSGPPIQELIIYHHINPTRVSTTPHPRRQVLVVRRHLRLPHRVARKDYNSQCGRQRGNVFDRRKKVFSFAVRRLRSAECLNRCVFCRSILINWQIELAWSNWYDKSTISILELQILNILYGQSRKD